MENSEVTMIVGLGNPGTQYTNTRHNIGFMVIDDLLSKLKIDKLEADKEYMFSMVDYKNKRLMLAKPLTFMNNSGNGIRSLVNILRGVSCKIIVIHDDLAFSFGSYRIKHGGGHAGHNGIRSCIEQLGEDFTRLRVGIGSSELDRSMGVLDYVLGDLSENEQKQLPAILDRISQIALYIAEHGIQKSMIMYNKR